MILVSGDLKKQSGMTTYAGHWQEKSFLFIIFYSFICFCWIFIKISAPEAFVVVNIFAAEEAVANKTKAINWINNSLGSYLEVSIN